METDVNTLFSAESRKAVKAAQVLLTAEGSLGMRDDRPRKTDDDSIRAGNDAMRALYEQSAIMLLGLAVALVGWFLILASRKSASHHARVRGRLGYAMMVLGLLAFAGGQDFFGHLAR